MVTRVIQIAESLCNSSYRELEFMIDNRRYGPYKLVASALVDYLRDEGRECAVTILVPESLVDQLTDSLKEAKELLRDKERLAEEAKSRLREVVAKDFDVRVIQGLGHHELEQKGGRKASLEFENWINNVSSYALVELTTLSDGDEELIFCTSTGHDAYLLALQMALSVYFAYRTFTDQASGRNGSRGFVLRTAYHTVSKEGNVTAVELEPTEYRAFFELPELSARLVAERTPEANELQQRLSELTEEMMGEWSKARSAFNAVRYNAPLALMYVEQPDGKRVLRALRDALNTIEERRSMVDEGDVLRVRRFRVDRRMVNGWVITAGLSEYLSRVIGSVRETGGRLRRLLEAMREVYREQRLGLNYYVLEHEANQITKMATEGMRPGERKRLSEVLKLKGSTDPEKQKRNFFAHAGLLADCTYVTRTEDGDLKLEYDSGKLGTVLEWVRDPSPSEFRGSTRT